MKTQKRKWEQLLEQHDKLVRQSNVTIYDRLVLLRKVWEDKQFAQDMRAAGNTPSEVLDARVRDTCANFTELLHILKLFPQKKQWQEGDLYSMRETMLSTLRSEQKERRERKKAGQSGGEGSPEGSVSPEEMNKRRLSWKERYLALESKYKQLEAAHKQLQKDYKEIQRAINQRQVG